jgi:hypothetical protein
MRPHMYKWEDLGAVYQDRLASPARQAVPHRAVYLHQKGAHITPILSLEWVSRRTLAYASGGQRARKLLMLAFLRPLTSPWGYSGSRFGP